MMLTQKPLILNLETSTEVCSVCLAQGGEVISLREAMKPNSHAQVINLLIENCFLEAGLHLSDVDAVALSTGPGSYTSLRVGTSTAKGICYALNKPLIAVDTLQALAQATFEEEKLVGLYCPMIDARRMEVYTAIFDHENKPVAGLQAKIVDESTFQEYFSTGTKMIFSGNGAEKCRGTINSPFAVFNNLVCSSVHLTIFSNLAFQKGNFVDLAYFTPNYLKAPNITTPRNTRSDLS